MAEEAEDFQAVGMKCRECLIQLARFLAKSEMFPSGEDAPQRRNFISLSALNQSSQSLPWIPPRTVQLVRALLNLVKASLRSTSAAVRCSRLRASVLGRRRDGCGHDVLLCLRDAMWRYGNDTQGAFLAILGLGCGGPKNAPAFTPKRAANS